MSEPLRVLHTVAGNLFGGVETLLITLNECPGLATEYGVCFKGQLGDELRKAGAVVHDLGGVRFSRPWTVWNARRRLERLVTARRYDVVVNHGCWPQLLYGPAVRRTAAALVFYMHDRVGESKSWVIAGAGRTVPDRVIVHSRATAATLPRLYPNVPYDVIHSVSRAPAIDRLEARAAVRAELGAAEGDVVIVTACRLEPWKGHRTLLAAAGRLRDTPGWSLWVAGGVQRPHEQAYLDELKAAAADLAVADRVRFLGHRGDVPRLFAAADVFCQPNDEPEPFGLVFIEALYAGLPVVGTRTGGPVEIVTDATGVLVPPGDAAALAATLSALVGDAGARARLGAAGPARAAALCGPEVVFPRLKQALTEAARGPRRSGRRAARPLAPANDGAAGG